MYFHTLEILFIIHVAVTFFLSRDTDGVVIVLDSSDKLRLVVVKEELDTFLDHPDVRNRNTPILVFSNKIDLRDSLSPSQVEAEKGANLIEIEIRNTYEVVDGRGKRVLRKTSTENN